MFLKGNVLNLTSFTLDPITHQTINSTVRLTVWDDGVIQAGRSLRRSLVQRPPQSAQLGGQGFIQLGLENLQGQRLDNLSELPDLVSDCFHWEMGFPTSSLNFSSFNSYLLCLILLPCPTVEHPASSSYWSPFRCWGLLSGSSLSLAVSAPGQTSPRPSAPSRVSAQALTI